jgi:hypothetical protein
VKRYYEMAGVLPQPMRSGGAFLLAIARASSTAPCKMK